MPMTAAPRARARSTVRLVSVVVPALADGDDEGVVHVGPQVEAGQLGGRDGVDVELVVRQAGRAARRRTATATAAVPWPMHSTRRMVPLPQPRPHGRRQGLVAEGHRAACPSCSTMWPRSVLAKLSGASLISFSRKWGASPRSMSRVVTSACTTSSGRTGSGVPS